MVEYICLPLSLDTCISDGKTKVNPRQKRAKCGDPTLEGQPGAFWPHSQTPNLLQSTNQWVWETLSFSFFCEFPAFYSFWGLGFFYPSVPLYHVSCNPLTCSTFFLWCFVPELIRFCLLGPSLSWPLGWESSIFCLTRSPECQKNEKMLGRL